MIGKIDKSSSAYAMDIKKCKCNQCGIVIDSKMSRVHVGAHILRALLGVHEHGLSPDVSQVDLAFPRSGEYFSYYN